MPALAANKITVTSPGAQTTNPLSAKVSLQIKATDSAKSALSYSAAGLPAGLTIGKTTGLISGTITKASVGNRQGHRHRRDQGDRFRVLHLDGEEHDRGRQPGCAGHHERQSCLARRARRGRRQGDHADLDGLRPARRAGDRRRHRDHHRRALRGGTYPVTVKVTDKTSSSASVSFAWKVAGLVTVKTPASERSWAGIPVSVQVKATDSDPAQKLSYAATGLPAGLAINAATGVISGTPAKTGQSAVTVTVTDGTGSSGTASVTWTVGDAISIAHLGTVPVTAGVALTLPVGYADAAPHDSVTLSVHGLPPGLTFEAHPATIFGWVTKPGTYPVTVTAARARLATASR